jgi:hypothetical protein
MSFLFLCTAIEWDIFAHNGDLCREQLYCLLWDRAYRRLIRRQVAIAFVFVFVTILVTTVVTACRPRAFLCYSYHSHRSLTESCRSLSESCRLSVEILSPCLSPCLSSCRPRAFLCYSHQSRDRCRLSSLNGVSLSVELSHELLKPSILRRRLPFDSTSRHRTYLYAFSFLCQA